MDPNPYANSVTEEVIDIDTSKDGGNCMAARQRRSLSKMSQKNGFANKSKLGDHSPLGEFVMDFQVR
jgi:hypothetical protein